MKIKNLLTVIVLYFNLININCLLVDVLNLFETFKHMDFTIDNKISIMEEKKYVLQCKLDIIKLNSLHNEVTQNHILFTDIIDAGDYTVFVDSLKNKNYAKNILIINSTPLNLIKSYQNLSQIFINYVSLDQINYYMKFFK